MAHWADGSVPQPASRSVQLFLDCPPLAAADGSVVFARRRQCAPQGIRGSLGTHESLLQTVSRSVQSGWESMCVTTANFVKSVELLPRYGDLTVFKLAAVRHLRSWKLRNFNGRWDLKDQYASLCQTSWRSVELLPRYGELTVLRWRLWTMLDF